jgi:hypothetical protein
VDRPGAGVEEDGEVGERGPAAELETDGQHDLARQRAGRTCEVPVGGVVLVEPEMGRRLGDEAETAVGSLAVAGT